MVENYISLETSTFKDSFIWQGRQTTYFALKVLNPHLLLKKSLFIGNAFMRFSHQTFAKCLPKVLTGTRL